jgi:hypothetical protein
MSESEHKTKPVISNIQIVQLPPLTSLMLHFPPHEVECIKRSTDEHEVYSKSKKQSVEAPTMTA